MEPSNKDGISLTPYSILLAAIREVPPVKYALGVAGVGATVAIILGLLRDPKIAVWGIIIAISLMFILVIFSYAVQDLPGKKWMVASLAWAVTILFIAALGSLFTSFVFGVPQKLASYFGQHAQSPMSLHTNSQTPIPQPTDAPFSASPSPSPRETIKVTPGPKRSPTPASQVEIAPKSEAPVSQAEPHVWKLKVYDFRNLGVLAREKDIGERFSGRILDFLLKSQLDAQKTRGFDSTAIEQTRDLSLRSAYEEVQRGFAPAILISGYVEDAEAGGFIANVRINAIVKGDRFSIPMLNNTYIFTDSRAQMDATAQSIGEAIIKFTTTNKPDAKRK